MSDSLAQPAAMVSVRRPMNFAVRLLIVQLLLATSAWAAAVGFTARYVAPARQLWFVQPLAEKGDYRICVTIFGPSGTPQREIVAIRATYSGGVWLMRGGWEIVLDRDTFEIQEVNQLNGVYSDFTLDPSVAPVTDSRLLTIGRATLFSEQAAPPTYANLSLLTVDAKSGNVTYLFARRATILVENSKASGSLTKVLTATISADANAPMIGIAEESQF